MSDSLSSLLRAHLLSHPDCEITDAVKFIYQNEFGGGHLIADENAAHTRLLAEIDDCPLTDAPLYEPVGNSLVRLNLQPAAEILSAETVFRLFLLSAQKSHGTAEGFESKLSLLFETDFPRSAISSYIEKYRADGYPAVSHSETYRAKYAPHYRIVREDFVRFIPLFAAVEHALLGKECITVGIDGMCASGKTTLAALLGEIYDCNIFHADDYFLPMEMRTPERLSEIGGNMHRERLEEEILLPLSLGKSVTARAFDCSDMTLGDAVTYPKKRINIVEGSYCLHPDIRGYYDVTAALKIGDEEQISRIRKRNPNLESAFSSIWIPMENRYFEKFDIFQNVQILL